MADWLTAVGVLVFLFLLVDILYFFVPGTVARMAASDSFADPDE